MLAHDDIIVEGTVIGSRSDWAWQVRLANGHELTAFATRRDRARMSAPGPGDRLKLKVKPFDLSKGRVVLETIEK